MNALSHPKYNTYINDTYGEAISPSELRIVRLKRAAPGRIWIYSSPNWLRTA
jgi:hypothetical protein